MHHVSLFFTFRHCLSFKDDAVILCTLSAWECFIKRYVGSNRHPRDNGREPPTVVEFVLLSDNAKYI